MQHNRDFDPHYGGAVELQPGIRRLTAKNPGPFTFHGTNTYLAGTDKLVVIDPGPADTAHIETILRAADGAAIEAILVTHTHMDHSPGAALLRQKTGAPVIGCGPHVAARALRNNEINPLDASADRDYAPDQILSDGEIASAGGMRFEAIATPGHTMNHLCFAISGSDMLFSADHVMAWSTSIVAPPDGNMRAYMTSLEKLQQRSEGVHLPGHGGPVTDAHAYMDELRDHRLGRERSILSALGGTPVTIPDLVLQIYLGLDPVLRPAAALSVFAHLEELFERGLVTASPDLSLEASYRLA